MGKFKQKINEQSVVAPSGFTGVIVDNSKIVIDKSYIEKGTSFVNVFNNSNAILKDCGSPKPSVDSNENIISKIKSKLESETDKRTLPFWVHHKIARFDNENTAVNSKNKSLIRLEVINDYDMNDEKYKKILDFRTTIESNSIFDNKTNYAVANTQYMLEQQILANGELSNGLTFSSKDIDYTKKGLYYLSGVTSSIKTVWPLDSILTSQSDSPKLNLNYVNREIFPYLNNSNKVVKVNNVHKTDSFGNEIDIAGSEVNSIAPNTFKYIVKSKVNTPLLKYDAANKNVKVYLDNNENGYYLNIEQFSNNNSNSKYYFTGPYLNDRSYISYYKNDKNTGTKVLQNDLAGTNEVRFYVSMDFRNSLYKFDLFDLINSNISGVLDNNTASGYFWNYYFNNKFDKGKLYLDTFSKRSMEYNTDNIDETCYFYGFKYNNDKITINESEKDKFLDSTGNDITSLVLRGNNEIDLTKKTDVADKLSSYYLSSPNAASIPISSSKSDKIMLVNNDYVDDDGVINESSFFGNNLNYNVKYFNNILSASCILSSNEIKYEYTPDNIFDSETYENPTKDGSAAHDGYLLLDSREVQNYLSFSLVDINLYVKNFSLSFTKNIYNLKPVLTSSSHKVTIKVEDGTNPDGSIKYKDVIETRYDYTITFKKELKTEPVEVSRNYSEPKNNGSEVSFSNSFVINDFSYDKWGSYITSGEVDKKFRYSNELFNGIANNNNTNTIELIVYKRKTGSSSGSFNGIDNIYDNEPIVSSTYSMKLSKGLKDAIGHFAYYDILEYDTNTNYNAEIGENLIYVNTTWKCLDATSSNPDGLIFTVDNPSETLNTAEYSTLINKTGRTNIETPFSSLSFDSKNLSFHEDKINEMGMEMSFTFNPTSITRYINDQIKNASTNSIYGAYDFKNELVTIFKNLIETDSANADGKIVSSQISGEYDLSSLTNDNDTKELFFNDVKNSNEYVDFKNSGSESSSFENINFNRLKFEVRHDGESIKGNPYLKSPLSTQYLSTYLNLSYLDPLEYKKVSPISTDEDIKDSINLVKSDEIKYEITINESSFDNGMSKSGNKELSSLANEYNYLYAFTGPLTIIGTFPSDSEKFIIDKGNIGTFVSEYFEKEAISPSSLFTTLSGIYKDTISQKFYVENPFIISEDGAIRSKFDRNKDIYVYPGSKLTTSILTDIGKAFFNDDRIYFSYDSEGNFKCGSNIDLAIDNINDLILYFDKNCKIPFEFDNDGDTKYLYSHNSDGKKEYVDENNKAASVSNGLITKYNYKYLYEWDYLTETKKELADFNDWYNIDTYIDYNQLNKSEGLSYDLKFKVDGKTFNGTNDLTIDTFKNDCFEITTDYSKPSTIYGTINDTRSLWLKSSCSNVSIDVVTGSNLKSKYFKFENDFSSLFSKRSVTDNDLKNYQGYKMFSFNFFIPSAGWGMFDEEMYKQNPNYLKDVLNNSESGEKSYPPLSELKSYSTSVDSFNGNFLIGYNVFNKRIQQTTSGTGSYKVENKSTKTIVGNRAAVVSCGQQHTLLITPTGKLMVCGRNNYGQLGIDNKGKNVTTLTEIKPDGKSNTTWQNVWATPFASFALDSNNNLWACGRNDAYQLGIGIKINITNWTPINRTSGSKINGLIPKSISGHHYYTIMITTDGRMWSTGTRDYGVLGSGNSSKDRATWTQIGTSSNWKKISCGDAHCLALNTSGEVFSWGHGGNYRLGHTNGSNPVTTDYYSPKRIELLGSGVEDILATQYTSFFIKGGNLYSCGYNGSYSCGANRADSRPLTSSNKTNTLQTAVLTGCKYIVGGHHNSYVIKNDGTLWSAGCNTNKCLGNNSKSANFKEYTKVTTPTASWIPAAYSWDINKKPFAAGCGQDPRFFVGLNNNEKWYGFGYNGYGQLGNGSTIDIGEKEKIITQTTTSYENTDIGIHMDDIMGFDCYWKQLIKFEWTATIKPSNIKGVAYQLTLVSNNETLQFTANLMKKSNGVYYNPKYTINGLYFSTTIRGKVHNIIIPSLNVYIEYNQTNSKLYMSLFYNSTNSFNMWGSPVTQNCVNYELMTSKSNIVNTTTFTKELRWSAELAMQSVAADANRWANISPIKTLNEYGYPVSYISLNHIGFTSNDGFDSADNYGISNADKFFDAISEGNKVKPIYDLEQFVKPFDMSTNLFYYKGVDSEDRLNKEDTDGDIIHTNDEVVIVNARKLYNKIPANLPKPVDSDLNINFKEFVDKEITLTGFIPINSDDSATFTELYPYVNNKFEYRVSENENDSTLIGNNYRQCRYTDYKSGASQFKLFKLNKDVVFTSLDDFNLNFGLSLNVDEAAISGESSGNKQDIPCKMSIVFDNLYFKQEVRRGCEFDNISDITFTKRIFPGDSAGHSGVNSIMNSGVRDRWVADTSITNILAVVPQSDGTLKPDGTLASKDLYVIKDGDYTADYMYGGSKFYNNIYDLGVIANSANKWSSVTHDSKYNDWHIFSDCYPNTSENGNLFGTPYCNMLSAQILENNIPVGTATSAEDGDVVNYQEIGEVVKIAQDIRNISIFGKEYEKLKVYPSTEGLISNVVGKWITKPTSYSISGKLLDTTITGLKKFTIGNDETFGIYFDGLLYEKKVYLVNENVKVDSYVLMSIDEENTHVTVEKDGTFSGTITFHAVTQASVKDSLIEIHNVKLPFPKISKIGITYNDRYVNMLDKNGYFVYDNNTWQKKIMFNGSGSLIELQNPPSILVADQGGNEMRSSINVVYDDFGTISGMMVSITLPGIKQFKNTTAGYILENEFETTLSTQEMVDAYHEYNKKLTPHINSYNASAVVGTTVLSGTLNYEYNKINASPLTTKVNNVGKLKYVYNPAGKNNFQLEVITKNKGGLFKKDLYYVNLPVENWYNMAIYRWEKEDQNGTERTSKIGFILDKIEYANDYMISNQKGKEIFECVALSEDMTEGSDIWCSNTLSKVNSVISSEVGKSLYKYDTKLDIGFDYCSRTPWNMFFSSAPSNILNNEEITDLTYNERKGIDLFNIGEYSINANTEKFENKFSMIKLFANVELDYQLNLGIENTITPGKGDVTCYLPSIEYGVTYGSSRPYFINYAPGVKSGSNTGYISGNPDYGKSIKTPLIDVTNADNQKIHEYLNQMIPRRIMFNDSEENYLLREKDTKYHINAVPGLKCKNIMFVSSPNLSVNTPGTKYFDNYNDSLKCVNDYTDYFNHPEHRLPPVKYKNHILSSDYATFIYNSCEKFQAANNDVLIDEAKSLLYDYKNSPNTIAYVWGNSHVSRTESIKNNVLESSKLYWTKSSTNEYLSEVGSIYNYQESQNTVNIVKIETGSINERQSVLMPVLTDPFEFEQRTATSGLVKVNDKIIATAALGYNSNGYPVNSILQYNSNGYVNIDTSNVSYLYISQQENLNDCIFGATYQKPVYVDAVQQNTQSLAERFRFLPNPTVSDELTGSEVDELMIKYFGGNYSSNLASTEMSKLFLAGERTLSGTLNNNLQHYKCYCSYAPLKEHTIYTYDTNLIEKFTANSSSGKTVSFIGNLLSFNLTGDEVLNKESLNVFYNEKDFENIIDELGGIKVNKSFKTMNCFTYDGKMLSKNRFSANPKLVAGFENMNDLNEIKQGISNYAILYDYIENNDIDIEPSFGVFWFDGSSRPSDYQKFYSNITKDLGDNDNNRFAIFDEYFSTNVTGFKLKIKAEHLQSAPIYIKVSLLKAEQGESGVKFVWVNDPILDMNLSDSYENMFDYSNATDKEVERMFINYPGKEDLIKHSFGIKFTIKQIVPQQNEYNACIIDDCEIYTSNILEKHGISNAVEDVFVRKIDANCRNNYKIDVNEYVWHLPSNTSEWHTVYDVLTDDVNNAQDLINEDSYSLISGNLISLSKESNRSIANQIEGDYFSYLNTYYFTNANESSNKITEVLSDNYLAESNIKISWKYIDYVYISYSCYSPNSMDLIDAYFGRKIYEAVKSKLLENINNLNSNSAFKDKYKFSGGIAKSRENQLDTRTNTGAFTWSNTSDSKNWTQYQNVYKTDYTNTKTYKHTTEIYQTYTDRYVNGCLDYSRPTGRSTRNYTTLENDVTKSSGPYLNAVNTLATNTIKTNTTVLENVKYTSVDNWTKTFAPIAIKYKIN